MHNWKSKNWELDNFFFFSMTSTTSKAKLSERSKSTLFVRNIPFTVKSDELEAFFSEIGPLRSCFIVQQDGASKGYGYVQFALNDDAKRALEHTEFEGKTLKIEFAKRKLNEKGTLPL